MPDDAELDLLRRGVSCAAVLEQLAGWRLDARESTRRALKYRRGKGEIIIVNHDGCGWWDATSHAKGDVFSLVRYLEPALSFGQACQMLRRFVGVVPTFPAALRERRPRACSTPAERWVRRPPIQRGDAAWSYLATERAIPATILALASRQDAIRCGWHNSAWFAHRWDGAVTHVEVRSATYKGSLSGGHKTLFRFGATGPALHRLAVLEAPIDALSLAALERVPDEALYVATGGGMGPGTVTALEVLLTELRAAAGLLVSATDANEAGDRFATRHAELAREAGVAFDRLRPPEGLDWNDVLVRARGSPPS
jgi:hypothetical protein